MDLPILSVRSPHATALIRWGVTQLGTNKPPGKLVGQRIAIHAGNSIHLRRNSKELQSGVDEKEFFRIMQRLEDAGVLPFPIPECVERITEDLRGILGTAKIVEVLHRDKDWNGKATTLTPWAVATFPYVWVFEDPEPFEHIHRCNGQGGVWFLKP